MRYLKLFKSMTDKKIEKICKNNGIENWSINKDGLVDVDGNVDLSSAKLTKLPLRFGRVTGDFDCAINNLTTLERAPTEVGGTFYCYDNKLTTLEGAPKRVDGNFYCSSNELTTLEGAPKEVGGDFVCAFNHLVSLEGAPKEVGGNFACSYNKLTTLKGAPREVSGLFTCQYNNLTTLKSAPEYVGSEVIFLPNKDLPIEFLNFLSSNDYKPEIQKYILKWQNDYAVWKKDGSFNYSNFIEMMENAQDEIKNIKFPKLDT